MIAQGLKGTTHVQDGCTDQELEAIVEELEPVVNEMDTCGHRYLNLEKKLGGGVCFALGASLSETQYMI